MSNSTISLEKVGSRIYVTGNTYPIRSQLKDIGCHWDGDRKQWWIGTAKVKQVEELLAGASSQPQKENLDEARVYGKVEYKGKTYYVIAQSRSNGRVRLTVLDGSIDFW